MAETRAAMGEAETLLKRNKIKHRPVQKKPLEGLLSSWPGVDKNEARQEPRAALLKGTKRKGRPRDTH